MNAQWIQELIAAFPPAAGVVEAIANEENERSPIRQIGECVLHLCGEAVSIPEPKAEAETPAPVEVPDASVTI